MTSGFIRKPGDRSRIGNRKSGTWKCPSPSPFSNSRFQLHNRDSVSRLENSLQVGEAPAYLSGRTVARIVGQHYVLFQHVPSIVAFPVQYFQHAPDVHVAVSQRHVESVPDRLFIRQRARDYPLREIPIHVLQVDVTNPRRLRLRQRDGIPAPDHRMSRVEAECCVATFQETLHVFGAFDLGSVVWVEHHAEAVLCPDLLDHRKRGEELVPLVVLQARGLLVAFLPCRRSDHEHAGAGRGEQPGLPLQRGKLRVAHLRAMEHGGHETSNQLEPVFREQISHLLWLPRQEAIWSGLEGRKAEAGGLVEHSLSIHLVAPSGHLANTPRDRRPCHAWHHPTSEGETGRCSASERSAAIAILSASSASVAVQGLSVSPLTREKKCSISALYASRKRSWKFG